MSPIVLRRKMSRRTRKTLKFVPGDSPAWVSAVCMLIMPSVNAPARPVSRPPARIGSSPFWPMPIRRLWKMIGVSPPGPQIRFSRPPKLKTPWPSRKNSRFSGKKRLKRVRLTCWSSASTCAKSVLTVKSAVSPRVTPYFASKPMSPAISLEMSWVRSVVVVEMPYGFNSMFLAEAGV